MTKAKTKVWGCVIFVLSADLGGPLQAGPCGADAGRRQTGRVANDLRRSSMVARQSRAHLELCFPGDTLIFPTIDEAINNLVFAKFLEPQNKTIDMRVMLEHHHRQHLYYAAASTFL